MTSIKLFVLVSGCAVTLSCSGGDKSPTSPPPTPVPTSIQLSATSVSLRIAESRLLTATVLDQQNRVMTGQTMTWRTSDTTKISVDAAGLVRGVRSGTAAVTVSSGSLTATASGTVVAPQIQLAAGTVQQTIGPEGGSLTTTDASGRRYTLTLSPGWKAESTQVAMTALAAIDNLPVGSTLLAGAHFAPEGLELDVPGTLTIEGVSAPAPGAFTGFGYTGTGADLYRASAGVAGGTMSFVVSHFSGTGAANVQDASTYPPAPLSGASWTYMQTVINLAQQGQQTGTYDVAAIVAAINAWSTQIVEPALVGAGSDALLVTALGRLRQWRYVVFCSSPTTGCAFGGQGLSLWSDAVHATISPGITAAHQRSHSEAKTSLLAARNRADDGCVVNQDLQAAKNGLYWLRQAELFFPGEMPTVASALADFCVKVVIEDASFPQNPAPNVPATLRVGAGLRFGTGPVTHRYPVDIEVNASGVTPGHRTGTIAANDPNPTFPFSFTPDGVNDVFFGIRVKEPWSGWDVHHDTTVHRALNVGVAVNPTAAILNPGAQATFTATVTGVSNTAVTWTATGGTITAGGVYTAGSVAGTYQVKATSVAHPLKFGTAQVTIVAVGGGATVQFLEVEGDIRAWAAPESGGTACAKYDTIPGPPIPTTYTSPSHTCTLGNSTGAASETYSSIASGQSVTIVGTGNVSANVQVDPFTNSAASGDARLAILLTVSGGSVAFKLTGTLVGTITNPHPASTSASEVRILNEGTATYLVTRVAGVNLSGSHPSPLPLDDEGTLGPGTYTIWAVAGSLVQTLGKTAHNAVASYNFTLVLTR